MLFARAIEQVIEDMDDVATAEAALRDYDPTQNVSLAEVKRRFGLDN